MSTMTNAVPAKSASKKAAVSLNQSTLPRELASGGVTTERIRERAYQIYIERRAKGESGDSLSDWLQAERGLTGSTSGLPTASEIETKAQSRGEKLLASGK